MGFDFCHFFFISEGFVIKNPILKYSTFSHDSPTYKTWFMCVEIDGGIQINKMSKTHISILLAANQNCISNHFLEII